MKLTIDRDALLSALRRVHPAIQTKGVSPVLTHVRIEAFDALSLAGTDLRLFALTQCPAEIATRGATLADARGLRDAAEAMPKGQITLALEDSAGGKLVVKSGKRVAKVPTLPEGDYPEAPTPPERWRVLPTEALSLVARAAPSCSTDSTRPHLACVLLEHTGSEGEAGRLRAVATNGHMMTVLESPEPGADFAPVLLPAPMLDALSGFDGIARLSLGSDSARVWLQSDGLSLACTQIDGTFPGWRHVVPSGERPRSARFDRAALLDAVKAAHKAVNAGGGSNLIRLRFGAEGLELERQNDSGRETTDMVEALSVEGDALHLAAAIDYVECALNALESSEVTLSLENDLDPIVLRDGNGLSLVMPMRVA